MAQKAEAKREAIFKDAKAFSSFSVNDIAKAKEFYGETLGINISDQSEGGISLNLAEGTNIFIYPKDNHSPATFTVLNFQVKNIEESVEKLKGLGIKFESFEGEMKTDENNIFRGGANDEGPNMAWFKDPAGNFLSVIEEK